MSSRNETNGAMGSDAGLRLRMRGEEHRIVSQHEKIDDLCREIYAQLEKDGPQSAMNDFLLFEQALAAHMTVEEDVYFPAFHGLRSDIAGELDGLVSEHVDLRAAVADVKQALKQGATDRARFSLESLARRIEDHEAAEEELIARINAGPIMETVNSSI